MERGPRDGGHVDNEVSFLQFWYEAATEERQRCQASRRQEHHTTDHGAWRPLDLLQHGTIPCLQPAHHRRCLLLQMAMASPPRVIVLRLKPRYSKTMTPVSSDRGIAVQEIAAVRTLNKNSDRTTMTKAAPMSNDDCTLSVAVWMNVAGRKRSGVRRI